MGLNNAGAPDSLTRCKYLWEEYKYRHDLIWQRIYRITLAAVTISIIPYIQQDIARLLGHWILLAPALSTILTAFALIVVWNELTLFDTIKTAYRREQKKLLDDDLKAPLDKKSHFKQLVLMYLSSLAVLSMVNGLVAWLVWLPGLPDLPAE